MNRCLRNIIGIKWPNTISNKELWERTRQEPIERTITTRRWKWIGHTLRKSNTNVTRQALDWNPQGHRKRGRPKSTWRRDLTSDLQKIGKTWGEAKKLAKDRKRWKATVVALCPPWDEKSVNAKSKRLQDQLQVTYRAKDKEVKRSARKDKRQYLEDLEKEAEKPAILGELIPFYKITTLWNIKCTDSTCKGYVKDKTLKTEREQAERWVQYFKENGANAQSYKEEDD
ncbi:Hypothetical predicted protein [Mytilus galloprovincialis]|uniref:Endonuclease-reverse transcriptase n=1 Tax=Mytilus galloprovincialis TaxID=29158 RepID=A0A8B6HBR8_MYTGA|nr:Hypothetical predicted protein [Mytilus galloprovincialis]